MVGVLEPSVLGAVENSTGALLTPPQAPYWYIYRQTSAAERTLMIGDTTHDLQLAANAGAAAIGVSYGAHDHESFAGFDTRHVAHSVAELHDWLLAHA